MPELLFPAPELAPDMAVRQAERPRRGRDGAVLAHRVQELHQRVADQSAPAAARGNGVGQFDLLHVGERRGNGGKDYAKVVRYLCKCLHNLGAPACQYGGLDRHAPMNTFSDSAIAAWQLLVSGDPVLLAIVGRSLAVSASACALACGFGLLLGAWLAVARFAGRGLLLTLLNTLLALPSVVVGLVIYLLLSRSGPLGFLGWLFSFKAMVLAQALLVLPVVTALTRQAIEDADRAHGEQLRSLGARTLVRALLLVWDERYALVTVLIAAFGRAVSEVGAVM